jgi:hypothetical protein
MHDALRYDKPLSWLQINGPVFKIDDEVAVEHEEELVVALMLVPVILALHDAETSYRLVDLAQSLVVPLVRARFHEGRHIDHG